MCPRSTQHLGIGRLSNLFIGLENQTPIADRLHPIDKASCVVVAIPGDNIAGVVKLADTRDLKPFPPATELQAFVVSVHT